MQNNFYNIASQIDDLVKVYSIENLHKIESYFNNDGIKNYFIKKLAEEGNLDWLIPLKSSKYFDPTTNPQPQENPNKPGSFSVPYWHVLAYLETVSKKNAENPKCEIAKTLLNICDEIINYRDENGKRIDNFNTDYSILIVLSHLPTQCIKDRHIEFIREALKSKWQATLIESDLGEIFLPKLLKDRAKDNVLHLLDVMLDYKTSDNKFSDKYTSIMDHYWLAEALKNHKPDIARICGIEAAEVALHKIKSILDVDDARFNYVWIPTIEDHEQITFPDRYECQMVQFVRDMYMYADAELIKDRVHLLQSEKYPIFRRIAYHTINVHYDILKELYWTSIANHHMDIDAKHEIYELISNNCQKFDKAQIDKLLQWIESNDYEISESTRENSDEAEKYIAQQKKEWLSALLKTKDKKVLEKYEAYSAIYPYELDHPGFLYWSESGTISVVSPISEEEFCQKSNEGMVDYINNFKSESHWTSHTQVSISDTFRRCISVNAMQISGNFTPFLKLNRRYQYILLWGFADAWKAEVEFDGKALLDFIRELLKPAEFWTEAYEEKSENYRNSIIKAVADLINDGTKSDAHAFEPTFMPIVEDILIQILSKTASSIANTSDIVTAVLNSPKGRVLIALVNYSLRYARLYKKKEEYRWVETVKKEFTRRLDRAIEPSIEFATTLGEYLPNLYYLDKKWVTDNISRILPVDLDKYWEAAFTGYLYLANRVYKEIYFLLKEHGHYSKAITYKFSDSFATERLAQHVLIGYIEGWDTLAEEESEIMHFLKNNNPSQLSQLVGFARVFRDTREHEIKGKIKPLWNELYKIIKDQLGNSEYHKIASNLGDWLSLVDKIDSEIVKWVKLSIKYMEHPGFFIDYLLKHSGSTPKEVGDIYVEMLDSGNYPTYKKETIISLVQSLYDKAERDIANKICNMYGAKGLLLLRDVYEKNNK